MQPTQERSFFNCDECVFSEGFLSNTGLRNHAPNANGLQQRALWTSGSNSFCQPSRHFSWDGEPFNRSLYRHEYCSQPSHVQCVEGVHVHPLHRQYLMEAENSVICNGVSPHYTPQSPFGRKFLTQHEVTLYKWYLIRLGDLHTSGIAIGGFLSSRCSEGDRFETAMIVKRLEDYKLLTKDGKVINLIGAIDDYKTVLNGFTVQMTNFFMSGFPHIWNLVVGTGLPAKPTGTNTDAEVSFEARLQKENSCQKPHLHALKGLETTSDSYTEGEGICGVQHVPSDLRTQSCDKRSDIVIETEPAVFIVDGGCQSNEETCPVIIPPEEKTEDGNEGKKGQCTDETQHEGQRSVSNRQKASNPAYELNKKPCKCTEALVSEISSGNQDSGFLTEIEDDASKSSERKDLGRDLDNMPMENVVAALSEDVCEGSEFVISERIGNDIEVKNHSDQDPVASTPEAAIESEAHGGEGVELVSVYEPPKIEGKLGMTDWSTRLRKSSRKSRKYVCHSVNDVEAGSLACSHLSSDIASRSPKNLFGPDGQIMECLVTLGVTNRQISNMAQQVPAKKGKHKNRRKFLLRRSKSSTKHGQKASNQAYVRNKVPYKCTEALVSEILSGHQDSGFLTETTTEDDASKLSERKDLGRDLDNMPMENVVAALLKDVCEGSKFVISERIGNDIEVKNHSDQDPIESTPEAAIESEAYCGEGLELVSVNEPQKIEGKLGMTDWSTRLRKSSLKSRKDAHHSVNDVEGGSLACAHLSSDTASKSPKNLFGPDDQIMDGLITLGSTKGQISNMAQQVPAKRGKHKNGRKFLLKRSKGSTKHGANSDNLPFSDNSAKKGKRQRNTIIEANSQVDVLNLKEAEKSPEKFDVSKVERSNFVFDDSREKLCGQAYGGDGSSSMSSGQKRLKRLAPPLPSPVVSVSKELVSEAFGLKTSKSGRLLVPPLAHWCGQSVVRDKDGGIVAIEDGSLGIPSDTGCFNFKPPIEARAKKLQEWLSETAFKCLAKKFNARKKGSRLQNM